MIVTEHVIVVLGVIGGLLLVHLHEPSILFRMSRPIPVMMQCQYIEVGHEPFLFTKRNGLQPMRPNADGNIVFLHNLEGLEDIVLLLLVIPGVTGASPQVGRRCPQLQMFNQQFFVLVDVSGDYIGNPFHFAAPLVPIF